MLSINRLMASTNPGDSKEQDKPIEVPDLIGEVIIITPNSLIEFIWNLF